MTIIDREKIAAFYQIGDQNTIDPRRVEGWIQAIVRIPSFPYIIEPHTNSSGAVELLVKQPIIKYKSVSGEIVEVVPIGTKNPVFQFFLGESCLMPPLSP